MNTSKTMNDMIIALSSEYRKVVLLTLEKVECDETMHEEIMEKWDSLVNDIATNVLPILKLNATKSKRTKKAKKSGPKRPKSGYIFFCQEKRSEVKEANPDMKATDITKELGMMWNEIKETDEASEYMQLAKDDKIRYNEEVENAPKLSDDEGQEEPKAKRTKKVKKSGPKRPKSAYIFFCQEKRSEVKEANPDMKPTEITSELGRLWSKIKDTNKAIKYTDLSKGDKKRYEGENEGENEVSDGETKNEEKKKKPKKKLPKKKEDVNEKKQKKATTAYNLFCQEKMQEMEEEFPELKKKDIKVKLSDMWKEMKENDKEAVQDYNVRVRINDEDDDEVDMSVPPFTEDDEVQSEIDMSGPPFVVEEEEQIDMSGPPFVVEEEYEDKKIEEEELVEEEDLEEEEDPELVGAKSLLEYLNTIKTEKATKGYKFNKDDFIEITEGFKYSDEITEEVNKFNKSKSKTLSVSILESLISLTQETIESYD